MSGFPYKIGLPSRNYKIRLDFHIKSGLCAQKYDFIQNHISFDSKFDGIKRIFDQHIYRINKFQWNLNPCWIMIDVSYFVFEYATVWVLFIQNECDRLSSLTYLGDSFYTINVFRLCLNALLITIVITEIFNHFASNNRHIHNFDVRSILKRAAYLPRWLLQTEKTSFIAKTSKWFISLNFAMPANVVQRHTSSTTKYNSRARSTTTTTTAQLPDQRQRKHNVQYNIALLCTTIMLCDRT